MDPSIKKNSYELLSMSSSGSDTPQQIQEVNFKSPRRKRLRKRLASGRLTKYEDVHTQKCCHSCGKVMSLSFIIIILCCWLLILSWLIVIFNDELKRFDNDLIAFGNQGIPESLQKCHAETKELQRNQSDLYTQFTSLDAKIMNLTTEVSLFSNELQKINDKLKSFSDSADITGDLRELANNVLSVHNRIDELNSTVAQLKASENHLEEDVQVFQLNLTSLKEKLSSLEKVPNKINNVSLTGMTTDMDDVRKLLQLVNTLNASMTYLNGSLTSEIQLLKQNPFQKPDMVKKLKNLLQQNISIRLDAMEDRFSQMSIVIRNLTYQINNTSDVKLRTDSVNTLQNISKNIHTAPDVPVTSNDSK